MIHNTPKGTGPQKNHLQSVEITNQNISNNLMGIALQSLYETLREENLIDSAAIFEDVEPAQTIIEDNKLLLQKVQTLENSL